MFNKLNLFWVLVWGVVICAFWLLDNPQPPNFEPQKALGVDIPIIQGNSLVSISPMNFPEIQVLGSIISCESSWNPNAKNPNSTAFGLCQMIDSTFLYVQKKWDMELDRFSEHDQMYACERLLREEGPDKHWAESKWCWDR